MANKKTKTDWVTKALAKCEIDRIEKGLSETKYYLGKIFELTEELPNKPFGSNYVPAEAKQVSVKKVVKTVYAARPGGVNSYSTRQTRY